jgi:putative tryptophan/tyrosine transport system substrate-binding protein
VEEGGLISYGANISALDRRVAIYIDRVLNGANPAELPVEQPTEFELAINLKTAKAHGLTISQSVLLSDSPRRIRCTSAPMPFALCPSTLSER